MTHSFLDSFWHCTQSQSIHAVRILENTVLATWRQVPDPQLQVQVQVLHLCYIHYLCVLCQGY